MQIVGTMKRASSEAGVCINVFVTCQKIFYLSGKFKSRMHSFLHNHFVLKLYSRVLFLILVKLTELFQKNLQR